MHDDGDNKGLTGLSAWHAVHDSDLIVSSNAKTLSVSTSQSDLQPSTHSVFSNDATAKLSLLGGQRSIYPDSRREFFDFKPDPPERFLYLSGSADTDNIRRQLFELFRKHTVALATTNSAELYWWRKYELKGEPLDQSKPIQGCLPDPRAPNCLGILAILGERIGTPLQESYFANYIDDLEKWTSERRRFKLLPEWPIDLEEQAKAVRKGYFPLTGTVFEYLCARPGLSGERKGFLAYISNIPIDPNHFDEVDRNEGIYTYKNDGVRLNGNQYESFLKDKLGDQLSNEQRSLVYNIQTYALKNFINAIIERGIDAPRHFTSEEDARRASEEFLFKPGFLFEHVSSENPYRPLEIYDVLDSDVFFGRKGVEDEILAHYKHRLWSSHAESAPPLLQISGPSGSGKSSLMRAGILGRLLQESANDTPISIVVLTPQLLEGSLESSRDVAKFLMTVFASGVPVFGEPLLLDTSTIDAVVQQGKDAPAAAARALADKVNSMHSDARIVIGIDQFEEIIDALLKKGGMQRWRPLFDFLEAAIATEKFGFVYTLESSRRRSFLGFAEELGLKGSIEEVISGDDVEFLNRVIRQPFSKLINARVDSDQQSLPTMPRGVLENELVNEIRKNYFDQIVDPNRNKGGDYIWSTLPLLAIKLAQLYDYADGQLRHLIAARTARPTGALITREDFKGQLGFTNVIEEIANEAWEIIDGDDDKALDEIDHFLTLFIRVDDDAGDRIQLLSAKEPSLISLRAKFERFRQRRLVVPDGAGHWRLAHEAVINLWPLAKKWHKRARKYLVEERALRAQAKAWNQSSDQSATEFDELTMRRAVDVLATYIRSWSFEPIGSLSPDEELLRKYALHVLATSDTAYLDASEGSQGKTAHVHLAASYGLIELLETFVTEDVSSIEFQSAITGNRPLHYASWNQPEAVRLLLKNEADPTARNKEGWPPIAGAITQENWDTFQLLLPSYSDPELHKCAEDWTLMYTAAMRGQVRMAEALFIICPDISSHLEAHKPLLLSIGADQWDTFKYFLDRTSLEQLEEDSIPLLHVAAQSSLKILSYLLELESYSSLIDQTDKSGFDALMSAAVSLNFEAVEILLKHSSPAKKVPANFRYAGLTALHLAILAASPADNERVSTQRRVAAMRTVRALLQHPDCDPNYLAPDGRSPFDRAKHLPEVRTELVRNERFDRTKGLSDWISSLLEACDRRDQRSIDLLLIDIADEELDVTHPEGRYVPTALLAAGYTDRIEKAVNAGTLQLWSEDHAKATLLRQAISLDVRSLFDAVISKLPSKLTADLSVQLGHALGASLVDPKLHSYFQELLEIGADADRFEGSMCSTLLHTAARRGDLSSFETLIKLNPRRLQDAWGRYPPEIAPLGVRKAFETILEAYMADMPGEEIIPRIDEITSTDTSKKPRRNQSRSQTHKAAKHGALRILSRLIPDGDSAGKQIDRWGRELWDVAPVNSRDRIRDLIKLKSKKDRPYASREKIMFTTGSLDSIRKGIENGSLNPSWRDNWGRGMLEFVPEQYRETLAEIKEAFKRSRDSQTQHRKHSLSAFAANGDIKAITAASHNQPRRVLETDAWGRELWELAPLSARLEISAIIERTRQSLEQ